MRRVVSIEIAWSKILFNLNTLGWWLARTFWTGHKYFYLRGSLTLPADGKPSLDKMILTSACSCTLSLCVYCDLYGCTKKTVKCNLELVNCRIFSGHVFDVAEAQVAQGPGEVLPLKREHRAVLDRSPEEPSVLKRILPNAGLCKA